MEATMIPVPFNLTGVRFARRVGILLIVVVTGCSGDEFATKEITGSGDSGPPSPSAITPDGKTLVVAATEMGRHRVRILDRKTRKLISESHEILNEARALAIDPAGKRVAVSCGIGNLRLLELSKLTESPREFEHPSSVYGIEFDRSGKWLATVTTDRCCRKWQIDDPKLIAQDCPKKGSSSSALSISADGRFVAWSCNNSIRILNAEDFSLREELPERHLPIRANDPKLDRRGLQLPVPIDAIAFSPRDNTLAYTLPSRGLVIRKGERWQEEIRIELEMRAWCLAFNGDGSKLFAGTENSEVFVFEIATGKKLDSVKFAGAPSSILQIYVVAETATGIALVNETFEEFDAK
jgi:WD40 repeat protein